MSVVRLVAVCEYVGCALKRGRCCVSSGSWPRSTAGHFFADRRSDNSEMLVPVSPSYRVSLSLFLSLMSLCSGRAALSAYYDAPTVCDKVCRLSYDRTLLQMRAIASAVIGRVFGCFLLLLTISSCFAIPQLRWCWMKLSKKFRSYAVYMNPIKFRSSAPLIIGNFDRRTWSEHSKPKP